MKMENTNKILNEELKIGNNEMQLIKFVLQKITEEIKDPESLTNYLTHMKVSPLFTYPSICMLLGESKELLNNEINWDDVSYQYMLRIKQGIGANCSQFTISLFSGLAGLGFAAYSLYKSTSHYKIFIDSLNKIIVTKTLDLIDTMNSNLNNIDMITYDTISGLSGVAGYLLLFKEEPEIRKCVELILTSLITMTKDRIVFGKKVAGWHILGENQFLEEEKNTYKKGNFNLGISHGITGVLAVLSIALTEGIEVEGQKNSINRILVDLKKYMYTDENGYIYWPAKIKFEDYINGKCPIYKSRASWCYGTPGIARIMYLAGKAMNDQESIDISIKAIEGICNMKVDELMIDSPTICHGYAGLLTVIQVMYLDVKNPIFDMGRKKILKLILRFYSNDAKFGFYNTVYNIDNNLYSKKTKLVREDDISFLQGTSGILLSLLPFLKPITTNWMRHLLIN